MEQSNNNALGGLSKNLRQAGVIRASAFAVLSRDSRGGNLDEALSRTLEVTPPPKTDFNAEVEKELDNALKKLNEIYSANGYQNYQGYRG